MICQCAGRKASNLFKNSRDKLHFCQTIILTNTTNITTRIRINLDTPIQRYFTKKKHVNYVYTVHTGELLPEELLEFCFIFTKVESCIKSVFFWLKMYIHTTREFRPAVLFIYLWTLCIPITIYIGVHLSTWNHFHIFRFVSQFLQHHKSTNVESVIITVYLKGLFDEWVLALTIAI